MMKDDMLNHISESVDQQTYILPSNYYEYYALTTFPSLNMYKLSHCH
jgi:hypothetical protein